ncbi:MAG: tyrosine-type recombinase/integrase [Bacteroidales bacterium]|nr:tyrosine-type recombinase/integrase [Bacteroidales bacterium]
MTMTIRAIIIPGKNEFANVLLRLRESKGNINLSFNTGIKVKTNLWNSKKEEVKAGPHALPFERYEARDLTDRIAELKVFARRSFENLLNSTDIINAKNFRKYMLIEMYPERYKNKSAFDFVEVYNKYIELKSVELSPKRVLLHKNIRDEFLRYERYIRAVKNSAYTLNLSTIDSETLQDFGMFYYNGAELQKDPYLKDVFSNVSRTIGARSMNTVNKLLRAFRSFINWAIVNEYTNNNPFAKYKIPKEIYGTPFYITIEERNQLYNCDYSDSTENLELYKDIFVFQCLIGCRVGDLFKLKKGNIINGAIEYIQEKTKGEDPKTIRVPLTKTAKEIINKYSDGERDLLFPVQFTEQHYNRKIKECFKYAKLDRVVTVLNPKTRIAEQKPLYEVASSHLARRTFGGNLYNKIHDPNIISSMTGHSEHSRAFSRYRTITDETKQSAIELLEDEEESV